MRLFMNELGFEPTPIFGFIQNNLFAFLSQIFMFNLCKKLACFPYIISILLIYFEKDFIS